MAAKVTLDSAGMRELLTSGQVRAALTPVAEAVAARARANAPVDSGEYRDSITVLSDTTDRAVERVVAVDDKSHVIEARTGNLARSL